MELSEGKLGQGLTLWINSLIKDWMGFAFALAFFAALASAGYPPLHLYTIHSMP